MRERLIIQVLVPWSGNQPAVGRLLRRASRSGRCRPAPRRCRLRTNPKSSAGWLRASVAQTQRARREEGRKRTPVPAAGQALVLAAPDLGGKEATRHPGVHADAALPLRHFAALERVCAGSNIAQPQPVVLSFAQACARSKIEQGIGLGAQLLAPADPLLYTGPPLSAEKTMTISSHIPFALIASV